MQTMFKSAVVVLALAGAPLVAIPAAANAAVGITFDLGNVAVGYSDGYYDNDHNFHRWAHAADARRYRTAHKESYRTWRHDDPKHQEDQKREQDRPR